MLKSREAVKQKYKESSTLLLPQEVTISNADEHFMSKMNELIDNNLANPDLDVSYLMKKMTMSRASLYNKVKALTGIGFGYFQGGKTIFCGINLLEYIFERIFQEKAEFIFIFYDE